MKVLQCGSIDIKTGGPALSTSLSMKGAKMYGVDSEIWQAPLKPEGKLVTEEFPIHYQNIVGLSNIKDIDIYHIQGLWLMPNHKMAVYARKLHKPYIITLRGMFYPNSRKNWKKRIAIALYQKKDLKNATCIQVTCKEEMMHYRNYGFTNPVAIIPNPIDPTGIIDRPIPEKKKFRFGYLGRVDPRKRIERLIYAFNEHKELFIDAELVIMGSWDKKYEQFLKDEVARLNLKNVIFTGFIQGKEKDETLCSLSVLVVPSDFENFGNIVTEALVRGVPVISSKGTPWEDLQTYNCGYWVDNDQKSINDIMKKFFSLSQEERYQMALNGRTLIKEKYSLGQNGKLLTQLYKWVAGKGPKPNFVYD